MIAPISVSALNPYKGFECDDALQHQRGAYIQIESVGTTEMASPAKKNTKKKKGVHTKRACWTAINIKPSKKTQKEKKGVQHEDFPGGQPS